MLPRPSAQEVREHYTSGLSTRQVALITGYCPTYVHKLCRDIIRDKKHAAMLRRPATSRHPRSSRAAARKLVERHLGRTLNRLEHVHHIDHDYTNNDLGNLEVKNAAAHSRDHNTKWVDSDGNLIPRSRRPNRIAWKKEWERKNVTQRLCAWCSIEFSCAKRSPQRTCSHSCGTFLFWYERGKDAS